MIHNLSLKNPYCENSMCKIFISKKNDIKLI